MKSLSQIFYAIACALTLCACSLNVPFEDKIADPYAVTDVASAKRVLAAAYGSYEDWQAIPFLNAMSDDVMPTPLLPKNQVYFQAYLWRNEQIIEQAEQTWNASYRTIMLINTLLERLPAVKPSTEEDRAMLSTLSQQAKALKALVYFRLVQLFSPRYSSQEAATQLGIVLKDNVVAEQPPRSSLEASAEAIRTLLIPSINASSTAQMTNRYISPLAARCILADLELWCGNYDKVLTLCEPLLSNIRNQQVSQSLYDDLWEQKRDDLSECLFNVDYSPFIASRFFDDWSYQGGDYLVIHDAITYEDTDIRKNASVTPYDFPIDNGASLRKVFLLGKYNTIRRHNNSIHYISIYRLADVVFLCAEAYARTGRGAEAIALLNDYLSKRQVATLLPEGLETPQLLDRILAEKQKEFLGEGRRYFDLKRLGDRSVERNIVFDKKSSVIASDDYRWTFPIPSSEYFHNENIQQNAGWQEIMPKPAK